MPDRYVKELIYEIRHRASVKYDRAQPATFTSEEFEVGISDSKATFEFRTQDIETEAEALETVSDYIERWELSAGLALGPDAFRLEYKTPWLEERNPVPGQVRLLGRARFRVEMGGDLTVITHPPEYPTPPSGFRVTSDVRSEYYRYMGYRRGRERLDSMAYSCLTGLEAVANQKPGPGGGREKAAKVFSVSRNVLKELGDLSSSHGRKAGGRDDPLTQDQEAFLEAATSAIILRMAEHAHDPGAELPTITLADLAPLR